jgi:uncharacterized membrane protein
MAIQSKWLKLSATLLLGIICLISRADEAVTLYTPYTKLSVSPGESVEYIIDVINNSKTIQNVDVSASGIPAGWVYSLKTGGFTIMEISVLPSEKKVITLHVEVPLKVNKGNYYPKVLAKGFSSLNLLINVAQQGTFSTEWTTFGQANMEGNANSTFIFNTNLKNRTAEKQQYSLMANTPRGWTATFKLSGQAITSITTDPGSNQQVVIEVKPPVRIGTGSYKIPVRAISGSSTADLVVEAVITGSYNMELTTPTGLLSTDLTAGESKQIELKIMNTGSSDLTGISLEASTPVNWTVSFDPKTINKLEPGKSVRVDAVIKADKKAIPGDYLTNIEAKTPEVASKISLRISVKTPMLWGWIGVLVILAALGSVYYLFRKYGRR